MKLNYREKSNLAGFSLLELVVVIFIIGLMVGISVIAIDTDDRERSLQQISEKLYERLKLAQEIAIIQGRELGLKIDANGYEFLQLEEAKWQKLTEQKALKTESFDIPVSVELSIQGSQALQFVKATKKNKDVLTPQIYLLSSGELLPFILILSTSDGEDIFETSITGQFDGQLSYDMSPL